MFIESVLIAFVLSLRLLFIESVFSSFMLSLSSFIESVFIAMAGIFVESNAVILVSFIESAFSAILLSSRLSLIESKFIAFWVLSLVFIAIWVLLPPPPRYY